MMCAFFSAIYSIQPKPLIDLWGVVPVASWGMMASGIAGLFRPPHLRFGQFLTFPRAIINVFASFQLAQREG